MTTQFAWVSHDYTTRVISRWRDQCGHFITKQETVHSVCARRFWLEGQQQYKSQPLNSGRV